MPPAILVDLLPGPVSSLPREWVATVAGGTMVWFATDGVVGFEPHALDLEGAALPLRQYGTRRFALGDPVLGGVWQLHSSSLLPADVGFALVGLPLPLPLPVALGGGQFVHFDIVGALFLGAIAPDPNGAWTTGIPLPNDPSLAGLDLVAQPLFVPSTQPVGVDLGDAWWITLGF